MPRATPAADKTLAERAGRLLRADILSGHLAPDSRLRIADLQARYGLGVSPLREALLRLASDGLVVTEGQRGFAVASMSLDELQDLTRARVRVTGAIYAEAVERGDADWEAGMLAAYHLLLRTPVPEDPQDGEGIAAWELRHRAFHHAMVAGCQSPWLLKVHAQLAEQAERYNRVRMFHSVPPAEMLRRVDDEHRELMEALLARDAARASLLARQHFEYTLQFVASQWRAEQAATPIAPAEPAALAKAA